MYFEMIACISVLFDSEFLTHPFVYIQRYYVYRHWGVFPKNCLIVGLPPGRRVTSRFYTVSGNKTAHKRAPNEDPVINCAIFQY